MAVQILLATRNGMRFLPAQLDSIAAQTWPEIDLLVADDGSTDGSWDYLAARCAGWTRGRARLIQGPRAGNACANFRHLIVNADPAAPYTAFADQDDIWLPGKLEDAIAAVDAAGPGAALFCARTALIDESGARIGFAPLFRRRPDFRNALVQSLGGGNTMLMNSAAFAALRESSIRTAYPAHDWWAYIIVSGAGGRMLYSGTPDVLYRQHGANAIGSNQGWRARWTRFRQLRQGRFRRWAEENIAALDACRDLLTPGACTVLDRFAAARSGSPLGRVLRLARSGVYRQTAPSQAMLYLAAAFGWL
ncbi:MAG TPA: glycosyltransferase [Devosia sp.]|nr:glycosyltransferase [Devosia sp.]